MTKQFTLITICLVLLAGCAKSAPKVAIRPEGSRTKLAAQVERKIDDLRSATRTMRGLAWVELDTADEDWQTEAAIIVERPDKLRIDVMDSLADVWARIGSDGRDMWLYVPGKRKLYRGRASSRNMRRLASFDSRPSDIISLLAGMPPLPPDAELIQVGRPGERHLFDTVSGLHLWVDKGRKRRISRCVRYTGGGDNIDYEIAFSDYRKVGGVDYPYAMDVRFPTNGARLKLEYKDVSLGGEVSNDVFSPPVTHGGKTVRFKGKR